MYNFVSIATSGMLGFRRRARRWVQFNPRHIHSCYSLHKLLPAAAKQQYDKLTGIHVYSVQKAKPRVCTPPYSLSFTFPLHRLTSLSLFFFSVSPPPPPPFLSTVACYTLLTMTYLGSTLRTTTSGALFSAPLPGRPTPNSNQSNRHCQSHQLVTA